MSEIEVFRNSNMIDPQLQIWGWEIPIYLFLGGLAGGLLIISALLMRRNTVENLSPWIRRLPFVSLALLSIGMLALFLDLELKAHVLRFYFTFQWTSPMSWGSWILAAVYPGAFLLGIAALSRGEMESLAALRITRIDKLIQSMWAKASRHWNILIKMNLTLGVLLGAYTGVLLSTLAARALWNSFILAPLFLISGFSTAAALAMLLPIDSSEHKTIRNWDLVAIGIEIGLIAFLFIDLANGGGQAGRAAAALFWGGPYTAAFWAIVLGVGLLVPLLIEMQEIFRGSRPTALAPLFILSGGLALRWFLVTAGQF